MAEAAAAGDGDEPRVSTIQHATERSPYRILSTHFHFRDISEIAYPCENGCPQPKRNFGTATQGTATRARSPGPDVPGPHRCRCLGLAAAGHSE